MTTQKRPQLCAHGASSSPAPGSLICRDDMNVNRSRSNLRMQRTGPDGSGCPTMANIWMNLLWFRCPVVSGRRRGGDWAWAAVWEWHAAGKTGNHGLGDERYVTARGKGKKQIMHRGQKYFTSPESSSFLSRQRSVRRTDWSLVSNKESSLHCHISINPEWDWRGGQHVGGDDHAKGAKMGEAARQEHVLLRRTGDDGPAEGSLLPHPVPHRRHLRSLLRFRVRLLCPPGSNKSLITFFSISISQHLWACFRYRFPI